MALIEFKHDAKTVQASIGVAPNRVDVIVDYVLHALYNEREKHVAEKISTVTTVAESLAELVYGCFLLGRHKPAIKPNKGFKTVFCDAPAKYHVAPVTNTGGLAERLGVSEARTAEIAKRQGEAVGDVLINGADGENGENGGGGYKQSVVLEAATACCETKEELAMAAYAAGCHCFALNDAGGHILFALASALEAAKGAAEATKPTIGNNKYNN